MDSFQFILLCLDLFLAGINLGFFVSEGKPMNLITFFICSLASALIIFNEVIQKGILI